MSERAWKTNEVGKSAKIAKAASLREQIYEVLRERIHAGRLTFEDRLVDIDVAAEFGVSRMPAREALMQLVHEGMLESSSRGFVLRCYSDREIEEIFEIRRLLEPAAAAIAARKMTGAALDIMQDALDAAIRASAADDFPTFLIANAAFRRAWMKQLPNAQLSTALARYIDHVQIVRLVTLTQLPVREDVIRRLRRILDAFRAGEAERVSTLVEQHVDAAALAYRTYRQCPGAPTMP